MFGQEGATDDERANEEPDRAGTRRCAGYLGYPFSNKKRKSHITPLSLATYSSDGEEMELRELSFTHFWNGYPQQHIQEEMAAVALVSPPGWEAALSQVLPALFRRVPLRSDLANTCWKGHCWLVQTLHEDDGSRVTGCGHTWCSRRWEPTPLLPGVRVHSLRQPTINPCAGYFIHAFSK